MADYNLDEAQKAYLVELDSLFDAGLDEIWSVATGSRGQIRIDAKPRSIRVPPPTRANLSAFADAQLLELRTDQHGGITFCRFRRNDIKSAIKSGWKKPSAVTGNLQSITIHGDVINSNLGNGSTFQNTQQIIGASPLLSDDLKASLQGQIRALAEQLATVEGHDSDKADVEISAQDVAAELGKEQLDVPRLRNRAENLAKAAERFKAIALPVAEAAARIVTLLAPLIYPSS